MVMVILSASGERFIVSRMQDLKKKGNTMLEYNYQYMKIP